MKYLRDIQMYKIYISFYLLQIQTEIFTDNII